MAAWRDVEAAAPGLAAAARARFDAHHHATLATLRHDGSPRISGIETRFSDGELYLGRMPGSRKALDLRRDPRLALHSATADMPEDPGAWAGDAKIAGRAVEVTDPAQRAVLGDAAESGSRLFRVDVTEVVLTRVGDPADHLVIDVWRAGQPPRRLQRR